MTQVGYLNDVCGSYNPGFLLMGLMISLSGLMLYPIPCIQVSTQHLWRNLLSTVTAGPAGRCEGGKEPAGAAVVRIHYLQYIALYRSVQRTIYYYVTPRLPSLPSAFSVAGKNRQTSLEF